MCVCVHVFVGPHVCVSLCVCVCMMLCVYLWVRVPMCHLNQAWALVRVLCHVPPPLAGVEQPRDMDAPELRTPSSGCFLKS